MAAPGPKLQNVLKDLQQIASMAGYVNHSFDPPQLRLFFTLYGRLMIDSPEAGLGLAPRLQAWCEALAVQLRELSSSAILPPQILVSSPQTLPDGRFYLVATITFNTKVTETSFLRVRTAVLAGYQCASTLRDRGLEAAEARLAGPMEEASGPAAD